jgi:hypothetical protein
VTLVRERPDVVVLVVSVALRSVAAARRVAGPLLVVRP